MMYIFHHNIYCFLYSYLACQDKHFFRKANLAVKLNKFFSHYCLKISSRIIFFEIISNLSPHLNPNSAIVPLIQHTYAVIYPESSPLNRKSSILASGKFLTSFSNSSTVKDVSFFSLLFLLCKIPNSIVC